MSVDSNIATPRAEEIVNKLRWNSISDKTDPGTLRQKLEELDKEATEISQLKKCFKEPALISKTPKHFALPPTELGELKLENKNLKLELQKIKKDITELEACKAQEAQLRQEVQGLQELTQQVEEAEALFERKKESNKTKLADFQGICDMEVTDATERIEQSHIKITALNDRSAIERQKIEELSIELDTESSNLTKLTSEMENLKTLNSNINEVQAQIEALEIKNEELAAMNQEKDQLILESNRKKILLNNEIADMQGKIRVFCRIRPLNEMETKKGSTNILTIQDEYTVYVESFRDFQYDAVFGPHVGQEHVFSETKRLVQSSVDGFNVCIFAYGQTGSGKTYTIQGEGDQIGIAPRAIDELYSILDHLGDSYDWVVTTYMVELYMDQLSDLLEPERVRRNKKLTVKLGRGNVSIPEAKVLEASSSGQLLRIFERGISDRQTNATAMNDISSRSHLIMTVMVNITDKRSGKTAMGKLNFVDLAGCERVNKAKGNASRIKEAMSINKSLSAISNVISALTKGQTHIPYRDHKLTELLSDSLGGTSKTLMFINVSPASYNRKETENALKFASIVKEIKNDPTKNVENREIQQLQKELAMKQQQREQYSRAVTESGITPSRIEELMALKSAILPNK